jgi:hypothetical protein
MKKIALLLILMIVCLTGFSQVTMSASGSYSQNFDALLNTGSVNNWLDNNTISSIFSQRTSTSTTYASSTGSSLSGGLYSFGSAGSTERALGTIGSANLTSGGNFAHGVLLQNTSGFTINSLNVSYTLEQWRNGGNTNPNTITFWYKVSSTTISSLTPGSNTGWTAVSVLNATSPINTATSGPLDGNNTANQSTLSNIAIPSLTVPNGSFIMLRWLDIDHTGTDHGLAIDNVSLNWTVCTSPINYFLDSDGDLFGNPSSVIQSCVAPTGYVTNDSDCDDANALINPNTTWYADLDGDTYGNLNTTFTGCISPLGFVLNATDCDDNNAIVNALSSYYQDSDQDGFGNIAVSISSCGQPTGYVVNSTDCDDTNPNVNAITTWYLDSDNDGFGNLSMTTQNCGQPVGYVANSTDCDDTNNQINPNATEVFDGIDNNCDLVIDEGFTLTTYYEDLDGDNYGSSVSIQSVTNPGTGYSLVSGDCDDNNNLINPNATEICDGIDNNCDLNIDENLPTFTYYLDADNDGFGDLNFTTTDCSVPAGYSVNSLDCNDANNQINPNATDIPANNIDEDCSGADAPLVPLQLGIYEFTQPSGCPVTATSVTTQPTTATFSVFSSIGVNCQAAGNVFNNNDWNTTTTIDLTEYVEFSITANQCQSLNLDRVAFNHRCSATGGTPTWYVRSSLDNYATDLGTGISGNNNNQNLDDTVTLGAAFDAVSNVTFRFYLTGIGTTGATFRFDNVSLYGNAIAITPQTFYADTDNDGFGDLAVDSLSCSIPVGFVLNSTDCNDADSLINPNTVWFLDADLDTFGDASISIVSCTQPSGYVLDSTDCNDNDNQITGSIMYYVDADNDTYGDFATGALFCTNPGAGYVTNSTDCDDTNNAIFPGATEICDGIDNDCVGGIDNGLTFVTYYVDADLDGFGTGAGQSLCTNPGAGFAIVAGDCNDTDDQINPDSPEVCDGIDNDCAGGIDNGLTFVTYYVDADNDTYGTGTGQSLCANPGAGFVTVGGDCNDNNNQIYPGATEVLDNSIDENCDGVDGYVGINELTLANFKIVPNPNNGTFNVILSEEVNNATISIQDLNGKTVQTSNFSGLEFQANLSGVTTGVYFVKIQTENSIAVDRVIIK